MYYPGIDFQTSISIKTIYSIHYYEYRTDFTFEGESHDFWEFVYADKGETIITSDQTEFRLKAGELYFHKPNEFHAVRSDGQIAPNLIVISFGLTKKGLTKKASTMNPFSANAETSDSSDGCSSAEQKLYALSDRILRIDQAERRLLASIIQEAKQSFDCRLDDPYLAAMSLKQTMPLGSGQLIRLYLEEFLLHLLRRFEHTQSARIEQKPASYKLKNTEETLDLITNYLKQHLHEQVTLEQICHDNLIGRTQLQKLMKEQFDTGAINYFHQLKIETAKQQIRSGRLNFTQISAGLGYQSIQYFSRQFKKLTGMTPTEYSSSIKALAENGFPE